MTNEKAKQLLKRAIASATRYGFAGSAEDIAQEVLCRFVEVRGKHQTVDQAVIDVIRSEFGSSRSAGHELRKAFEQSLAGVEIERSPGTQPVHRLDFERLTGMLPAGERIVAKLTHEWGFTGVEIADLFGVTESRVSQRLTRLQAGLSETLAKEKSQAHADLCTQVRAFKIQGPGVSREAPPSLEEILSGLPVKGSQVERPADRIVAEIEPWQMALDYEAGFQEWLT